MIKDGEAMSRYESAKLGAIEYHEDQVITFIDGILGFPGLRRYVLLEHKKGVFMWLQCLEEPSLAFLVVDPWLFFPDYSPEIPDEDVEALELKEPYNFSVFCFVTVPSDPRKMTVNLKGPTVVNLNTRKAKQVVLLNQEYSTRHRVFDDREEAAREEGQEADQGG